MADRLAAKDIALTSVNCSYMSFGNWDLTACNGKRADGSWNQNEKKAFSAAGPEYIRAIRDGREGYLQVESSPSEYLSGPFEWREELRQEFAPGDETVFEFVERYLILRLAGKDK